ncbi:hypothetical protein [Streptomyces niveus]|uniref:hypothetical protein n=1 Tax=Streptomyces niveus TaxID=193462 RepID=UPI00386381C4
MTHFLSKVRDLYNTATTTTYVRLQVLAATEPVRLRALLLSAVAAVAFLFPAVADEQVAESIAGIGVVAMPLLVGESARRKVSPAGE